MIEQDKDSGKSEDISKTSPDSGPTSNAPVQESGTIGHDESQKLSETADEINEPKNEEDDEWEVVNETLLYADCVGAVESELIEPGKSVLLVDLDTENPLIQVSFISSGRIMSLIKH